MTKSSLSKEWRLVKLGELAVRVMEKYEASPSSPERWVGADHLDEGDLRIRRWSMSDDPVFPPTFKFKFPIGAVLIHSRNPKKVAVSEFSAITGEKIFALSSRDDSVLSSQFLALVLQSVRFEDFTNEWMTGSVNKFLNWSALERFEFVLPPIAEQRRIIKLMLAIDDSVEEILQLGRVLSECKRSLFSAAVRGRSTSTSLAWGEVSSAIPVVKLGSVCAITRGSSPRPKGDPRYFSIARTPHHWIMIADLSRSKKGKFLTDTAQFLTAAGVEKSRKVEPGTLLLTNCATVGVPVFSGISGGVHDGFLLFEPRAKELSKEFLFRMLEHLTEWFPSISQTGTQANLNTGILKDLEIPLLSVIEQEIIVNQLDMLDSLSQATETQLSSLKALRGALLSSVLVNDYENV